MGTLSQWHHERPPPPSRFFCYPTPRDPMGRQPTHLSIASFEECFSLSIAFLFLSRDLWFGWIWDMLFCLLQWGHETCSIVPYPTSLHQLTFGGLGLVIGNSTNQRRPRGKQWLLSKDCFPKEQVRTPTHRRGEKHKLHPKLIIESIEEIGFALVSGELRFKLFGALSPKGFAVLQSQLQSLHNVQNMCTTMAVAQSTATRRGLIMHSKFRPCVAEWKLNPPPPQVKPRNPPHFKLQFVSSHT